MDAAVELRPTIDRAWLESAARTDPLLHAYPLWDLLHLPHAVRFHSAVDHGRTVAYLLEWRGGPGPPVVHWVGDPERSAALVDRFPPPPCVGIVPPEGESALRARFPRAIRAPVIGLWRARGAAGLVDPERLVRRLGPSDASELRAWSGRGTDRDRPDYAGLDLAAEHLWGAFPNGRLAGVTRAAVRLPRVWVVSGVFVDPELRGHGIGRRLVGASIDAANDAGAATGLFVREDAAAARRTYAALGFREVVRRLWFEAPAGGASGPAVEDPGR